MKTSQGQDGEGSKLKDHFHYTSKPLDQCWVAPIIAFYNQQGLLHEGLFFLRGKSLSRGLSPEPHEVNIERRISVQNQKFKEMIKTDFI